MTASEAVVAMPLPAATTQTRRRTPKERRTRLMVRTTAMWAVATLCLFVGWAFFSGTAGGSGSSAPAAPRKQSLLLRAVDYLSAADVAGAVESHLMLPNDLQPVSAARRNDSDDEEEPECEHIERMYPQMCEFVKAVCEDDGILPYLQFRYCKWGGDKTTSRFTIHAPIMILWFFLIIALLASTAEQFFVPALEHLSEELKLSPDVAGITLVAFGNGGPDIVSAVAALRSDGDYALAVGGLVGAAIFILTLCVGIIYTLAGQKLLVQRETFLRDIIAMIVCTATLAGISADNRIWIYEAFGILGVYVVYVSTVVYLSKRNQRAANMNRLAAAGIHNMVHHSGRDAHGIISDIDDDGFRGGFHPQAQHTRVGSSRRSKLPVADDLGRPLVLDDGDSIQSSSRSRLSSVSDSSVRGGDDAEEDENPYAMYGVTAPEAKAGWITKILYVLEFPFSVLRWLTIPSHELWDRRRKVWTCLSMPGLALLGLFCVVEADGFADTTMGFGGIPVWSVVLVVGALMGIAVWFWTPEGIDTPDQSEDPLLFVVPRDAEDCQASGLTTVQRRLFMVLAFVGSICWLYLVADEAVAILQTLGIMWDLSTAILGITVLAIGNSIGDLAANLAVARGSSAEGPATAVASCFGSPLLNFMLGLGLALVITCADTYPEPFRFETDHQVNLAWVALGVVLLINLILLPLNGYRPRPYIGVVLAVVYGIFLLLSVLMEVDVLKF